MNARDGASVVLLAPTLESYPLETLYSMWLASRNERMVQYPEDIRTAVNMDLSFDRAPEYFLDRPKDGVTLAQYFDEQIDMMLSMDVPLLEAMVFVFVIENMSISLREQLVRHRKGAYWLQSGRIRDQRSFADRGEFRTPVSIQHDPALVERWQLANFAAQEEFKFFLDAGMRIEDARDILPFTQLHRGSVVMNYRALKEMTRKRTSFIAQHALWTPVLTSLAEQINNLDPRLMRLFEPPSILNGKYIGDPHKLENERRLTGDDPLPPDPIFMQYETTFEQRQAMTLDRYRQYLEYAAQIVPLWGETLIKAHCWGADDILQAAR